MTGRTRKPKGQGTPNMTLVKAMKDGRTIGLYPDLNQCAAALGSDDSVNISPVQVRSSNKGDICQLVNSIVAEDDDPPARRPAVGHGW